MRKFWDFKCLECEQKKRKLKKFGKFVIDFCFHSFDFSVNEKSNKYFLGLCYPKAL